MKIDQIILNDAFYSSSCYYYSSGLTLTLNDYKMGKQTLKILHQLLQDLTCVWPFYGHKAL